MSGDELVVELTFFLGLSTFSLAAALCTAVISLIMVAVTQEGQSDEQEVRLKWWLTARWVVAQTLAMLMVGIITSFFVFNRACFVKFPDIYMERTGGPPAFTQESIIGFYTNATHLFVLGATAIAVVGLGLAKRNANTHQTTAMTRRDLQDKAKADPRRALSALSTHFI
jgi:hypothetical protein